jgi:catechol 2,3-dioxygenase-like lactoylglutathione lyase family enzyme
VNFRLELVTAPVSDVYRAKAFYVDQVGFSGRTRPPGRPRSPLRGAHVAWLDVLHCPTTGYVDAEAGSLKGVQLNVEDTGAAHAFLRER